MNKKDIGDIRDIRDMRWQVTYMLAMISRKL